VTSARGATLWGRVGLAYAAALVSIVFFVLLAVCYQDPSGMTAMTVVVPGVLAVAAAPLCVDLREGMTAQDAVDRMAVGIATGAGALYLLGALVELGVFSRQAGAPVLVFVLAFPLCVALGSGLRRSTTWAWFIESVAFVLGGVGWLLILRRAIIASLLVARGPMAVPMALAWPAWVPERLLDTDAWSAPLMMATLPFACFLSLRVRKHVGECSGALAGELLLGVLLLGWSFRLAGIVGLGAVVLLRLTSRTSIVRWRAYAVVVVLSLLPIDVSMQRAGPHGFGFLPARGGDYTGDALSDPPRRGFVFVEEGFYYSPRWVWVW
jgi:hypothetical protein